MSDDLLYKFRSFNDYGLRLLIDREVYFASPEELNDPLDGQMSLADAVKRLIDDEADPSTKDQLIRLAGIPMPVGGSEYRDTPILEAIDISTKISSILSFSKSPCDPLMWSHYSDAHRGFCVGFFRTSLFESVKADFEKGGGLVITSPINYRTHPSPPSQIKEIATNLRNAMVNKPSAQDFEQFKIQIMNKVGALVQTKLTEKDARWGYEMETRFILNRTHGPVAFNPSDVRQIIFGLKTSKENCRTVRNILRGPDWEHIDFLQVRHRTNSFEFELVEQSKA